MSDFTRDAGTLAAMLAMVQKTTPKAFADRQCVDCASAGFHIVAKHTCTDVMCDLKPLCPGHAMTHEQWGHVIVAHVFPDEEHGAGGTKAEELALGPDVHVGITQCPEQHHKHCVGGELVNYCSHCCVLVCRACMDLHLDKGHTVQSMAKATDVATGFLHRALPGLMASSDFYKDQISSLATVSEELHCNLDNGRRHFDQAFKLFHEHVDIVFKLFCSNLEQQHAKKTAELESRTKRAQSALADIETVVKVAGVALECTAPQSPLRVLAANTVSKTIPLVRRRDGHGIDPSLGINSRDIEAFVDSIAASVRSSELAPQGQEALLAGLKRGLAAMKKP